MTFDALAVVAPEPRFDHLLGMSDGIGTFAMRSTPSPDASTATAPTTWRGPSWSWPGNRTPAPRCAPSAARRCASSSAPKTWWDTHGTDVTSRDAGATDLGWTTAWGRSIAAFGTAANRGHDEWMRQMGMASFGHAVQQRSVHFHAMAFAGLGTAEVLHVDPRHHGTRELLHDAIDVIGRPTDDLAWPWTDARLSYANANVAEALLAAGHALHRPAAEVDGPVELAPDEPAVADDGQRGGPQGMVGRTCECEGVLGPADDLAAHPAEGEVPGGHGDPQGGVGVALGGGRPDGGAEVGEVPLETVHPRAFVFGLHGGGGLFGDVPERRGVLGPDVRRFWAMSELVGAELPQRLELAVANTVVGVLGDDEGAVDEGPNESGDVLAADVAVGARLLDGVEVEPASEHGQPVEQLLLGG